MSELSKKVDSIGTLEKVIKSLEVKVEKLKAEVSKGLRAGQSVEGARYVALKVVKKGFVVPEHMVKASRYLVVKRKET